MTRLDKRIVEEGLAESRAKAARLIESGVVRVNGTVCGKVSASVLPGDYITLDSCAALQFISQGGEKLRKALHAFHIDLRGKTVLDIGASTGGFTDCSLQHGASRVYSVDVGRSQLHPSLRLHPQVRSLEQQDIRTLRLEQVGGVAFEAIVCDVAFISLTLIVAHIARLLAAQGRAVCLVKPQFEVGPGLVNRHGIVASRLAQVGAIRRVCDCAKLHGLTPAGLTYSPIGGRGRNTEYLLLLLGRGESAPLDIEAVVTAAHDEFANHRKG